MIRVAILGASGFVGAELLRLCAQHPHFRPEKLYRTQERVLGAEPQKLSTDKARGSEDSDPNHGQPNAR